MIHIKSALQRVPTLGAAATLLLAAVIPAVSLTRSASAGALTNRGLEVSSTVASNDLLAPDGSTYTVGGGPGQLGPADPRNGRQVTHTYTFTPATSGDVEGLTIEYCESAFGFVGQGACTATNLLAGGVNQSFSASTWGTKTVTIGGQTYNITANAANYLTLVADSTPANFVSGTPVTITFTATANEYFVNPNASYKAFSNGTYFAHIQTFSDGSQATAAFGFAGDEPAGVVDDGTVTNNVTTAIGIYTRVQETLNFSVEGDEAGDGATDATAITSCDPLTEDGRITMGDTNNALSSSNAYDAKSYFRLATNSANGVAVSYSGDTLKNGSATPITASPTGGAVSDPGTEQFGLGIDITDADYDFKGLFTPESPYNVAAGTINDPGPTASFAFNVASIGAPVPIATSTGVVECSTGAVRYVANIAPETPAGIYQTKINYIASPRY